MPSKRNPIEALRMLEADRLAIDERKRELEEQAALELGRIVLGTGLEAFSRKGLARVAVTLGKLGEEAALQRLGLVSPSAGQSKSSAA